MRRDSSESRLSGQVKVCGYPYLEAQSLGRIEQIKYIKSTLENVLSNLCYDLRNP